MSYVMSDREKKVFEEIQNALNNSTTGKVDFTELPNLDVSALEQAEFRTSLVREHNIVVRHNTSVRGSPVPFQAHWRVPYATLKATTVATPTAPIVVPSSHVEHEMILSKKRTEKIISLLGAGKDWKNRISSNIIKVGPKGSGKSESTYIEAKLAGFDKVYRVNGNPKQMDSSEFVGYRTVEIDKATGQNHVVYVKGVLEIAMTHGLKKDANGLVEIDKDGNVQVISAPALLYIDEWASIPAEVMISLNRAMEIPRAPGMSRTLELSNDRDANNIPRTILSHPGFCVMAASNVVGHGLDSDAEQGYTAQDVQHDESVLDRFTAIVKFGYSIKAEDKLIEAKIGERAMCDKLKNFRNMVRQLRKDGAKNGTAILTLLSTRKLVQICNNAVSFRADGISNWMVEALYHTVYCSLYEAEKPAWREQINLIFGSDLNKMENEDKDEWML